MAKAKNKAPKVKTDPEMPVDRVELHSPNGDIHTITNIAPPVADHDAGDTGDTGEGNARHDMARQRQKRAVRDRGRHG